jgi:hypothetical protein
MFNVEWFDKVNIKKDGNCMFRSLSTFVNNDLTHCRRKRNGDPVNKELSDKENELSKSIRLMIVTYMDIHQQKFNSSLQYDNDFYDSIKDRIEIMSNDGEYGSNLELYIMSKMFKIQINVFVKNQNGFNLISKIGKDSSLICNLFYENCHYELLILKPENNKCFNKSLKEWAKENPNINFEEIVNSDHSDSEYEVI